MKVLIFLSPCALRDRVSTALNSRQFVVETSVSAKECLQCARLTEYEAVLVEADPDNYGEVLVLVELLRQEQSNAAIFVFERHLDLDQRLHLLDSGVDDCVREPFASSEFAMRLGVSIRLHQAASSKTGIDVLRSGDLELNLVRRIVTRLGKQISLRPKEFLLLEYLVRNANRPVTRAMILDRVWNSSYEGLTNVVDVYINSLRNKVDRDFPQKLIQTNRGIGYTFICREPVRGPTISASGYKLADNGDRRHAGIASRSGTDH